MSDALHLCPSCDARGPNPACLSCGDEQRQYVRDNAMRAEGERAATERIVKWLRTGQIPDWLDQDAHPRDTYADAIERGEHNE